MFQVNKEEINKSGFLGDLENLNVDLSTGLVLLSNTHTITSLDVSAFKKYGFLKRNYEACENMDGKVKAIVSVVASILFQERKFFAMTRKSLKQLVENDANWIKSVKFSDNHYKIILAKLFELKIIKQVEYVGFNSRKACMYEVISQEILSLLVIDFSSQEKQTLNFVLGEVDSDSKGVLSLSEAVEVKTEPTAPPQKEAPIKSAASVVKAKKELPNNRFWKLANKSEVQEQVQIETPEIQANNKSDFTAEKSSNGGFRRRIVTA